jgi:hypothetical protein
VETPHGALAIEHLVVGDRVLGLSDDGMSVVNEVVEVHRGLAVQYYIINDEISVTGAHPFLVGDEWVEAQDIRVGDTLRSSARMGPWCRSARSCLLTTGSGCTTYRYLGTIRSSQRGFLFTTSPPGIRRDRLPLAAIRRMWMRRSKKPLAQ